MRLRKPSKKNWFLEGVKLWKWATKYLVAKSGKPLHKATFYCGRWVQNGGLICVRLAYEAGTLFYPLRPSCKSLDLAAKGASCVRLWPAIHENAEACRGERNELRHSSVRLLWSAPRPLTERPLPQRAKPPIERGGVPPAMLYEQRGGGGRRHRGCA